MEPVLGVRKEDEVYYQGAFWIAGDSVRDIKRGNFGVIGIQLPCDYQGNYLEDVGSKNPLSYKDLWNLKIKYEVNPDVLFDYYPRGGVSIYRGQAWIHIHSLFNQPSIIDTIVEIYNLHNIDYNIDLNDTYQGSHYDFGLE